jgi:uncharacterized protein (TIGR01619 family)
MSDHWNSYFCNVNDKLSSIFVDLGIRQTFLDEGRPWLMWVWVYFKQPRPDGLSSKEEYQTLAALEDQLVSALEQKCATILAGRITTDGHREFYFYGSTPEGFEETVNQSFGSFPGYKFDCDKREDPGWKQYLDVLYPPEEELERIKNRELTEVLKQKGDHLESVRDVRHWAYFQNAAARENFRNAVQAYGYRIESESEDAKNEYGYGVCVVRKQEMAKIDDAVIQLFRESKSSRGRYDGWECELMGNAKAEKPGSRWMFWK